jgi:uncharacterized protein (TIGR04255 family)
MPKKTRTVPDLGQIRYRRNYLSEVIVRLDFLSPLQEVEQKLSRRISQRAKTLFPIAEPRDVLAREVQVSRTELRSRDRHGKEWVFHGREREKRFVIGGGALYVSYSLYSNYEVLREEFLTVMNTCFDVFPDMQGKRLGLRYINNFDFSNGDPLVWEQFLNNDMLSLFRFAPDPTSLSRIFHVLEFNYGDHNLRYQFGMPNPDFPAAIRQRLFVLDFDAYFEGVLEREDIQPHLDKFHDKIQTLFEYSITDLLRRLLNE